MKIVKYSIIKFKRLRDFSNVKGFIEYVVFWIKFDIYKILIVFLLFLIFLRY